MSDRLKKPVFYVLSNKVCMKQLSNNVLTDNEKLEALLTKLAVAEEKLKYRLSHFRGVPHESATGELNYSELKVLEDYVEGLKKEVETLRAKTTLGEKSSHGPKV